MIYHHKIKSSVLFSIIFIFSLTLASCGGGGGGNSDYTTVSNSSTAPVANAGADQQARNGWVALDGRQSSAANGKAITYLWSITSKPSGSNVALDSNSSSTPSFVADKSGTYEISLTVKDGGLSSASDSVTITTNAIPKPDRGNFDTLDVLLGNKITLDASNSSDPDGDALQFRWAIQSAPIASAAQLTNSDAAVASFMPDATGQYIFDLKVSDGFLGGFSGTYGAIQWLGALTYNVVSIDREGPRYGIMVLSTASINSTLGMVSITHRRGGIDRLNPA